LSPGCPVTCVSICPWATRTSRRHCFLKRINAGHTPKLGVLSVRIANGTDRRSATKCLPTCQMQAMARRDNSPPRGSELEALGGTSDPSQLAYFRHLGPRRSKCLRGPFGLTCTSYTRTKSVQCTARIRAPIMIPSWAGRQGYLGAGQQFQLGGRTATGRALQL